MMAYEKIDNTLREADIEGLIESGAPENEYDIEAKAIFKIVKKIPLADITEDCVLEITYRVWEKYFNRSREEVESIEKYFRAAVQQMLK